MEKNKTLLCVDCRKVIDTSDTVGCIICETIICNDCADKHGGCCKECFNNMESDEQVKGIDGKSNKAHILIIPILCIFTFILGVYLFSSNLNYVVNGTKVIGYVVDVEKITSKIDHKVTYMPSIQFTDKEGNVVVAKSINYSTAYKDTLHKNLNVYYMRTKPKVVLVSNSEAIIVPIIVILFPILSVGLMYLLIKISIKSIHK